VDVREGEAVKKDQVLARLDTTDVEMSIRSVQQEYNRAMVELSAAFVSGDDGRIRAAQLNLQTRLTQLEKLQRDLDRLTLRAPYDGVVWNAGTLATRIGQMTKTGEPLLDVIKPGNWKVRVDLREQDLRVLDHRLQAREEVTGHLRLAANPVESFPLAVTSREQLNEGLDASHGEYIFQVEVPLEARPNQVELIKSGMAGRASFACGRRPLAYVLFRDFVNFIRLRFF
jgi:multidrug efflux pump subunit AcrA (membrane-fusion protein)